MFKPLKFAPLVAAIALLVPTGAIANEIRIPGTKFVIDDTNILVSNLNPYVRLYVLEYDSGAMFGRATDCQYWYSKNISYTSYPGAAIQKFDEPWKQIAPGTVDDAIAKLVCSYK